MAAKPRRSSSTLDVVTGKTKIEYFFDPGLLLPDDSADSLPQRTPLKRGGSSNAVGEPEVRAALAYSSRHLFMPCVVVKDLEEQGGEGEAVPALVKTADGVLHKIRVSRVLRWFRRVQSAAFYSRYQYQ